MKAAILALSFVFAVTSLSAQTKKSSAKTTPKGDTTIKMAPEPLSNPVFNFRIDYNTFNMLVIAIQSSTELDASTANRLVKFLVGQANDTTMNKSGAGVNKSTQKE